MLGTAADRQVGVRARRRRRCRCRRTRRPPRAGRPSSSGTRPERLRGLHADEPASRARRPSAVTRPGWGRTGRAPPCSCAGRRSPPRTAPRPASGRAAVVDRRRRRASPASIRGAQRAQRRATPRRAGSARPSTTPTSRPSGRCGSARSCDGGHVGLAGPRRRPGRRTPGRGRCAGTRPAPGTPCSGSSTLLVPAPTRLPEPAATRTTATARQRRGAWTRACQTRVSTSVFTAVTTATRGDNIRSVRSGPREGGAGWAQQGTTGRTHHERARDGDVWTPLCEVDQLPLDRGVDGAGAAGTRSRCSATPEGDVYAHRQPRPVHPASACSGGASGAPAGTSRSSPRRPPGRRSTCARAGASTTRSVSVPAYAVRVVDGVVQWSRPA